MLPARHLALTAALEAVVQLQTSDQPSRLRVGLADGSVVDGVLVSASAEHVSLLLPSAKAQHIPADQIHSVYLGTRRTGRELLIVSGIILGVTGVLVGAAQVPLLLNHMPRIAGGLTILAFAAIMVLKRRTGLGSWLTGWKRLFEAGPPGA